MSPMTNEAKVEIVTLPDLSGLRSLPRGGTMNLTTETGGHRANGPAPDHKE